MPDPAAGHHEEEEEEDEEEGVSDNPLPAWMEGDSLAPPCQADMDVVRAIIDFAGVTENDVSCLGVAVDVVGVESGRGVVLVAGGTVLRYDGGSDTKQTTTWYDSVETCPIAVHNGHPAQPHILIFLCVPVFSPMLVRPFPSERRTAGSLFAWCPCKADIPYIGAHGAYSP